MSQTGVMSTGRQAAIAAAESRMGELGLTQAELAERARVPIKMINRFLNGQNWPQVRNRAQISVALWGDAGVLNRIASGEEPPHTAPRTADDLRRLIVEAQEELTWLNPRYESTRKLITARLEREIADLQKQLRAIEGDTPENRGP
jgi:transcriptional regulator with XRE-family HTH domain